MDSTEHAPAALHCRPFAPCALVARRRGAARRLRPRRRGRTRGAALPAHRRRAAGRSRRARAATTPPTFHAILQRLAASDLIVYLQRGSLLRQHRRGHPAACRRPAATATCASPWSSIPPATSAWRCWATSCDTRSSSPTRPGWWTTPPWSRCIGEIGYSTCEAPPRCYDTEGAVRAGRQVLHELRGMPPAAARRDGASSGPSRRARS